MWKQAEYRRNLAVGRGCDLAFQKRRPIVTWQDINNHNVTEAIHYLKTIKNNMRVTDVDVGYSLYRFKVLFGLRPPLLDEYTPDLSGRSHTPEDLAEVNKLPITNADRDKGVINIRPATNGWPSERAPILEEVAIKVRPEGGSKRKITLEGEIMRAVARTGMSYKISFQ
jgi:hypothetical protein